MKKLFVSTLALLAFGITSSQAEIFLIDLSPPDGEALNLGTTVYTRDHVVGVGASNAVGEPASAGTGDEVSLGVYYDDVTMDLSYDIVYGSVFGFVDLEGDITTAHFHGNVLSQYPDENTGAGVSVDTVYDNHVASGTLSGRFTGVANLDTDQETALYDNEFYLNIHSTFSGGGEIRGQLVPVARVQGVPTLTQWGILSLILLLAGFAYLRIRKLNQQKSVDYS